MHSPILQTVFPRIGVLTGDIKSNRGPSSAKLLLILRESSQRKPSWNDVPNPQAGGEAATIHVIFYLSMNWNTKRS